MRCRPTVRVWAFACGTETSDRPTPEPMNKSKKVTAAAANAPAKTALQEKSGVTGYTTSSTTTLLTVATFQKYRAEL